MNYKCALITGASSGIGAACARDLARLGLNLRLLARREDRLQKLAKDIQAEFGVQVDVLVADVRRPSSLAKIDFSGVDVLVNNAGLARGVDKVYEADVADWDVMIDTNVKGLLYLTRAILPTMVQSNRGHIVNLGSVAGRWVYPGGAVYCASKFAVRALSEGLRMDLLGTAVRVTNIEPGLVETEFSKVRLQDPLQAQKVYEGYTPLTAQDVAESIAWCLQRPAHVNVQELVLFPVAQAGVGAGMVHRQPNK